MNVPSGTISSKTAKAMSLPDMQPVQSYPAQSKNSTLFFHQLFLFWHCFPLICALTLTLFLHFRWVSNFWIHERGQEESRPCSTDPFVWASISQEKTYSAYMRVTGTGNLFPSIKVELIVLPSVKPSDPDHAKIFTRTSPGSQILKWSPSANDPQRPIFSKIDWQRHQNLIILCASILTTVKSKSAMSPVAKFRSLLIKMLLIHNHTMIKISSQSNKPFIVVYSCV